VLKEHDQVILGLDWAPKTNRIVSCSQDRNAYVWTFNDTESRWKPTLVILRINRAATSVKWSPEENKFAVGSGAKLVSICHFEEENDWWVSKHIKKHRSTITSVAWHPNNILIATGSTDFKCRIFSAFIKGVDKAGTKSSVFTSKNTSVFGELLAEFDQVQGWVHAVTWSPNGNQLAFTGHDSRVAVADVSVDPPNVSVVKSTTLPYTCLLFVSENTLVAAGHDCNPQVLSKAGAAWKNGAKLDVSGQVAGAHAVDAKSKFQTLEKTGQENKASTLSTKHQNTIKTITSYGTGQIATSGIDGNIIVWNIKA
jgi:actin related protein 2/3 complex subunit 1A/1B